MTFNEANEREQLVFNRPYDAENYRMGGISHFDHMSVETAKKLLEKGYIDPQDTQNSSPTASEMIAFCDDGTDKWYLHGYVVSPERDDCRVTFEGAGSHVPLEPEDALSFARKFRNADELDVSPGGNAWCWYD